MAPAFQLSSTSSHFSPPSCRCISYSCPLSPSHRQPQMVHVGASFGLRTDFTGSRTVRFLAKKVKHANVYFSVNCVVGESKSTSDATGQETPFQQMMKRKQGEISTLLEIIAAVPEHPVRKVMESKNPRPPTAKLTKSLRDFGVIAEVKRRTVANAPNLELQRTACKIGGATAISVQTDLETLTDETNNGVEDLRSTVETEGYFGLPVVRRDLIVHPVQIAETVEAGAHGLVLMAPVLKDGLRSFLRLCLFQGIEAIVEVRTLAEAQVAIDAGAKILGVFLTKQMIPSNKTREELLQHMVKLRAEVPSDVLMIAGAVATAEEAFRMQDAGYCAVFLREDVLPAENPGWLVKDIMSPASLDLDGAAPAAPTSPIIVDEL